MATDYTTVSLPVGLMEQAARMVAAAPTLGYKSKSEFVADAVRRRIEELEDRLARDASGVLAHLEAQGLTIHDSGKPVKRTR